MHTLLRGTIVNRTYGVHKNLPGTWYIFTYFYSQYLVLFTVVPCNTRPCMVPVRYQHFPSPQPATTQQTSTLLGNPTCVCAKRLNRRYSIGTIEGPTLHSYSCSYSYPSSMPCPACWSGCGHRDELHRLSGDVHHRLHRAAQAGGRHARL